jgi:hypothetical protein
MRVSAQPGDPGYCLNARQSRVFFEGAEVTHVITADEKERYIKQYILTDGGMPKLSEDGSRLLVDERYGHVRIETPPGWFPWK